MTNTTNNPVIQEPTVQAIMNDKAFQLLFERDNVSPEGITNMMSRVARERTAQGWTR